MKDQDGRKPEVDDVAEPASGGDLEIEPLGLSTHNNAHNSYEEIRDKRLIFISIKRQGLRPLGRTIPIPSIDAWERIGSETCDWQGPSSEFRSVDPEFDPPRRSFCAPISQAAMLWFAATASGAGRLRDPPGKRRPDRSVNSFTSALTNRSVKTSRRLGSCDAKLRHFDVEGAREDASARLSRRRPGFTVRHLHQDGQPPAQFGRLELTHRQCLNPCGDLPLLRIPTKPAMHSKMKPATYSDFIPAAVPI
ncbi:hypothetical protein [Jiella pelagia]|uniref:Uncharacterized protein n=1 Tax=Jiella pelagia TaxID=2986949 RepID=A0ABY7BTV8_9HYPH|nr:hypothetical protein [Jiella pelagia]WAP67184.1 hypothetical protein OH818_16510 [Jiella pelagia]